MRTRNTNNSCDSTNSQPLACGFPYVGCTPEPQFRWIVVSCPLALSSQWCHLHGSGGKWKKAVSIWGWGWRFNSLGVKQMRPFSILFIYRGCHQALLPLKPTSQVKITCVKTMHKVTVVHPAHGDSPGPWFHATVCLRACSMDVTDRPWDWTHFPKPCVNPCESSRNTCTNLAGWSHTDFSS